MKRDGTEDVRVRVGGGGGKVIVACSECPEAMLPLRAMSASVALQQLGSLCHYPWVTLPLKMVGHLWSGLSPWTMLMSEDGTELASFLLTGLCILESWPCPLLAASLSAPAPCWGSTVELVLMAEAWASHL